MPRLLMACLLAMTMALPGCAAFQASAPVAPPPPPPPPPVPAPPPPPPPPPMQARDGVGTMRAEPARPVRARTARLAGSARTGSTAQAGAAASGAMTSAPSMEPTARPVADARSSARPAAASAPVLQAQGAAPTGNSYCPAMEDFAPADDCARYTTLAQQAPLGIAALGAPRAMAVGQFYPVKLVVGKQERAEQIERAAGAEGEVSTGEIKLGPWICAELKAADFEVRGDLRQCKRKAGSPQLSFDWEVSPQQPRDLMLSATVQSLTEKNGQPLDQIDSETIRVAVTADGISSFDHTVQRLTGSAGGLRTFLLAVLSALGVLSVIVWRVRNLGKKPDKDALKDLTAT